MIVTKCIYLAYWVVRTPINNIKQIFVHPIWAPHSGSFSGQLIFGRGGVVVSLQSFYALRQGSIPSIVIDSFDLS